MYAYGGYRCDNEFRNSQSLTSCVESGAEGPELQTPVLRASASAWLWKKLLQNANPHLTPSSVSPQHPKFSGRAQPMGKPC